MNNMVAACLLHSRLDVLEKNQQLTNLNPPTKQLHVLRRPLTYDAGGVGDLRPPHPSP